MGNQFAGFGPLVGLHLRRDRWLLPIWVLAFAGIASFSAAATAGLYPTEASRIEAATAVNSTSSLVALFGRVWDPTSLGELSLIKLTAWGAAFLAVVMVFFTIRHTRGDEETGRLELVMAGRVGRWAPLASALTVVFGASLILGVLTAIGLTLAGLPIAGSIAFGGGWACIGIVFSAIAGVFAQLTASVRGALGASLFVIAVAYIIRAIADITEPAPAWFIWLSPFGWNEELRAYSGARFAVLLVPILATISLVALGFALRDHRDLGAGYGTVKSGAAHGRIRTVWGLAFRLQWRTLVVWLLAFFVFGLFIGSLANSMTGLLSSENAQRFFEALGGREGIVNATLSAYVAIMGIIAAGYAISASYRMRSEESSGHAELLLATRATRSAFLFSHAIFAIVGTLLLMIAAGLGIGISASLTIGDNAYLPQVLLAAILQTPATWLFAAIVIACFGWFPRITMVAWAALAAALVIAEFGVLWELPQWLIDLSPFTHTPRIPVETSTLSAVVVMAVIAMIGVALGVIGWHRRDVSA